MKDLCKGSRKDLIQRFFPDGIPSLWCPLLTHYTRDGVIDYERMEAHLKHIVPWVKGYLVPGSTGDGWEMTDVESRAVLEFALKQAEKLNIKLLVGVLKTDTNLAYTEIKTIMTWLKDRTCTKDDLKCLEEAKICGFTMCPPKGKQLSQNDIKDALAPILELNLPIALYQLPQITENEISPDAIEYFAQKYSNFYLFKDSSGIDKIALSKTKTNGVFLVRGAEGEYTRWLQSNSGPYNGFLLSTANCFARELHNIVEDLSNRRVQEAKELSDKITNIVNDIFNCVASLPYGNAFTNANKALDHFFAYGPNAINMPAPRLHSGGILPSEIIKITEEKLDYYGLMPSKGYLNSDK